MEVLSEQDVFWYKASSSVYSYSIFHIATMLTAVPTIILHIVTMLSCLNYQIRSVLSMLIFEEHLSTIHQKLWGKGIWRLQKSCESQLW